MLPMLSKDTSQLGFMSVLEKLHITSENTPVKWSASDVS